MPKDIKLRNESGRVDPRLKGGEADADRRRFAGEKVRQSLSSLKKIAERVNKK